MHLRCLLLTPQRRWTVRECSTVLSQAERRKLTALQNARTWLRTDRARGGLGAQAVVRTPADGHTLVLITSTMRSTRLLYDNTSFNVVRDIAAIASITLTPYTLVANPAFVA